MAKTYLRLSKLLFETLPPKEGRTMTAEMFANYIANYKAMSAQIIGEPGAVNNVAVVLGDCFKYRHLIRSIRAQGQPAGEEVLIIARALAGDLDPTQVFFAALSGAMGVLPPPSTPFADMYGKRPRELPKVTHEVSKRLQ